VEPGVARLLLAFAREEPNGHPPFYALLGLAGWAVSRHALPPPGSYRFGPAVLFALTVGAVYALMTRHYGRAAGVLAALGLLTMPRVFAHAHWRRTDVPTLCLWFLAVAAFLRAVGLPESPVAGDRRWTRTWAWSGRSRLAWPGLRGGDQVHRLVPAVPPGRLGGFLPRPTGRANSGAGGHGRGAGGVRPEPDLVGEPVRGVRVFLESNLTRERLRPIPTVFFGRLYRFSLPWYNTLVWTAIVVPPVTLGLALVGSGGSSRPAPRPVGTLLLGCWAFFMVLRALPNAPGHDGERQFLVAFVFLACLSGIGLTTIASWLGQVVGPRVARTLAGAVLIVAVGAGAWSTWAVHPLQLS